MRILKPSTTRTQSSCPNLPLQELHHITFLHSVSCTFLRHCCSALFQKLWQIKANPQRGRVRKNVFLCAWLLASGYVKTLFDSCSTEDSELETGLRRRTSYAIRSSVTQCNIPERHWKTTSETEWLTKTRPSKNASKCNTSRQKPLLCHFNGPPERICSVTGGRPFTASKSTRLGCGCWSSRLECSVLHAEAI